MKLFWPKVIDISDGELRNDGGGYFPILSQAWNKAEASTDKWSEWHQLMVWALFCGYHKLACESLSNNQTKILFSDIDKKYVEQKLSESLFATTEPNYPRQMRRAYKNDIKKP